MKLLITCQSTLMMHDKIKTYVINSYVLATTAGCDPQYYKGCGGRVPLLESSSARPYPPEWSFMWSFRGPGPPPCTHILPQPKPAFPHPPHLPPPTPAKELLSIGHWTIRQHCGAHSHNCSYARYIMTPLLMRRMVVAFWRIWLQLMVKLIR